MNKDLLLHSDLLFERYGNFVFFFYLRKICFNFFVHFRANRIDSLNESLDATTKHINLETSLLPNFDTVVDEITASTSTSSTGTNQAALTSSGSAAVLVSSLFNFDAPIRER